jgi:hypothetical protein
MWTLGFRGLEALLLLLLELHLRLRSWRSHYSLVTEAW